MSRQDKKPPREAPGGQQELSGGQQELSGGQQELSGDPLEELMQMKEPYLEDAGFTARVLAGLPPPRARLQSRRVFILSMFFSLAFAVAFILFPGVQQVTLSLVELTRFEGFTSELPIASMVVIAMLVWGGVMAAWSEG